MAIPMLLACRRIGNRINPARDIHRRKRIPGLASHPQPSRITHPRVHAEIRKRMATFNVTQGIGQLAAMPDDGSIGTEFDARVARTVQSHLEAGYCESVYMKMPVGAYTGVIDNVRSKIVEFALGIQDKVPSEVIATGRLLLTCNRPSVRRWTDGTFAPILSTLTPDLVSKPHKYDHRDSKHKR